MAPFLLILLLLLLLLLFIYLVIVIYFQPINQSINQFICPFLHTIITQS